jgi:hypothetical protein
VEVTKKDTEEIKQFWNENPVGSNFIAYSRAKNFTRTMTIFDIKLRDI